MVRITSLGLAVLAALLVVVFGTGAVSASTHEFVASKTGKTTSKQTTPQTFKTGAGTIACSTVAGKGEITALKSTVHKEELAYSGCEAFGYPKVKITAVDFEFNAEGTAKLEKDVVVTPEGSGCHVTIPAQTVGSITYSNESGKLKAVGSMSKIHSEGSGGECGGNNTEGSYTGTLLATLENGTVEWK